MDNKKKILGLDLGVASLGWAVSAYDEKKKEWYIDDFGVRLWDSPEDSKTLDSLAKKRREFRSQRRLTRRRQQRINDVKNIFINNEILTKDEIENHLTKLTTKNNNYSSEDKKLNSLVLREQGLTKKLTNIQLFIVVYSFAKRRGYENMFSLEKEDREVLTKTSNLIKKYELPIKAIMSDELKGQYRNSKDNNNYLFTRDNYKAELEQILKKQKSLKVINEETSDNLFKVIFRQRFFEDSTLPKEWHSWDEEQKEAYRSKIKGAGQNFYSSWHDTIGRCTYYPDKKRVSKKSIYSDIFVIYNELSKVTEKLSNDVRKDIFKYVTEKYLRDYDFSRTIVKDAFEKSNEVLVYKSEGISFAKANFFLVKLSKFNKKWLEEQLKILDGDINNIEKTKIETLGDILGDTITPQKIINELKEKIPELLKDVTNDEILDSISKAKFTSGRNNVSREYVKDLMESSLNEGIMIQDFAYNLLSKNSQEYIDKEIKKVNASNLSVLEALKHSFKANINDSDMERNAVVFRSINQTRLVLRALLKKYETFTSINFEIARDLYASLVERKEVRSFQNKNEKRNIEIRNELERMNLHSTNKNVEKYKLWNQQKLNKADPYAIDLYDINLKEKITLKDAILGDYEVDHIIPYSLKNDNTLWNKVITSRKHNQLKGKKTPIAYFNSLNFTKKEIDSWKVKIKKTPLFIGRNIQRESIKRKLDNLFMPYASRDGESLFESKDLNDIRYISKYMNIYLNNQFKIYSEITSLPKPKINSVVGRVTSLLRREWLRIDSNGVLNPWGLDEKVREITPYHHSIDAMVISQFENFVQLQFTTFFINLKSQWRYLRNKIYDQRNNEGENKFTKKHAEEDLRNSLKEFKNFSNRTSKTNEDKKNYSYLSPNQLTRLESFCEYLIKNILTRKESLADLNTYSKPLVKNLSDDILKLIPIKLVVEKEIIEINYKDKETGEDKIWEKEIKAPKFEREVHPKEWSEINKRDEKEFPFPSYKINKRIRGEVFGRELPVPKSKAYDKDGNFLSNKYYKDSKGTIWSTSKYLGLDISSKEKGYEFIRKIDCKNKTFNKVLSRNVSFILNDQYLIYKGCSSPTIFGPSLLRTYSGKQNYRNKFGKYPEISKNTLQKDKMFKIENFDILGKNK